MLAGTAGSAAEAPRADGRAGSEAGIDGVIRLARLADVDGDGQREVVVMAAQKGFDPNGGDAASRRDALHVLGASAGRLAVRFARDLPSPASGMAVADVTGDGTPELLAITRDGLVVAGTKDVVDAGSAFLYEDHSDLDLELAVDVSGDGMADLVLPGPGSVEVRVWTSGVPLPSWPRMVLPARAVSLGSEAPTPLAMLAREGSPPRADFLMFLPVVRDLDADGRMDAVMPLSGRLSRLEGVRIHFGTAEGGPFDAAGRPIELDLGAGEMIAGTDSMGFGDLDGDGVQELGVLTYDLDDFGFTQTRRLRVFRFAPGYVPDAAPLLDVETSANVWEPSRVSLDDLDGDGRGDLLVTHIGGLRKTAFTAEHHVRRDDGRFVKREQTLKIPRDDAIDRSALLPPADLDGDGRADFVVVGKRVVYVLAGILDGSDVFREPALRSLRPAGVDKVLAVLVDAVPGGPSPLYVVYRAEDGGGRVLREDLRARPSR